MIEVALQQGYPILNKQLTVIATDKLIFQGESSGRAIYNETMKVRT